MSAPSQADVLKMTRLELRTINDLNKRMNHECFMKCIPKARDAELQIGEMSCIDRCAPKYFETHELVQKQFEELNAARQASAE
jgi:import inner membrane translocase subunit TIM10